MTNDKVLLYKSKIGSRLYGTHSENSDRDFLSVCAPKDPLKIFCISSSWDKGKEKNDGEVDEKLYDIRRFVSMALSGQTMVLESLFADSDDVEYVDPVFELMRTNRKLFLWSKMSIVGPALGYAQNEYRMAIGETTGKLGEKRKEDLKRFGYSPKSFHHCLRVMKQALYALETGEFSPYPFDHGGKYWKGFLLDVKAGIVPLNSVTGVYRNLESCLKEFHIRYGNAPSAIPENDRESRQWILEETGRIWVKVVKREQSF